MTEIKLLIKQHGLVKERVQMNLMIHDEFCPPQLSQKILTQIDAEFFVDEHFLEVQCL